ncbi:MAG TPA: GMC family oxidoreductase N-terminal domain-containing protein [Gaiellaceae bacterium]
MGRETDPARERARPLRALNGFDYVIVGAGSAGCVLAARLSEDPAANVLLLEAGGEARRREIRIPAAFSRLYGTEVDWGYRTEPQTGLGGREVYFPRGRVIGGCSSVNAQIALRGYPADYDGWGILGWGWEDVAPYFERAAGGGFELAAQRAPSALTGQFLEAAAECGIPDAALCPVNQRRGRRWSIADGYLRPARSRRNLTVRTNSHVTKVVLERGRARGVELAPNGRIEAAREVILCAGAINSPQLLLLSGIGPAGPVHELPGVGRNLQDHVVGGLLAATSSTKTLYRADSVPNLLRYLLFRRGPLTSNVAEAAAFVSTHPELVAPDLELVFAPVIFENEGLTEPKEHGLTIGAVVLQPASAGSVRLRAADPLAPPLIDPAYLSDPGGEDLRVLLEGTRLARRLLRSRALAPHVREELVPGETAESDEELARAARDRAQTLYHPVGTCRMGAGDDAVVDAELRVHGIEGLRVVDASVLPRIPRGHTNWPTVAVAEKAADLIRA